MSGRVKRDERGAAENVRGYNADALTIEPRR